MAVSRRVSVRSGSPSAGSPASTSCGTASIPSLLRPSVQRRRRTFADADSVSRQVRFASHSVWLGCPAGRSPARLHSDTRTVPRDAAARPVIVLYFATPLTTIIRELPTVGAGFIPAQAFWVAVIAFTLNSAATVGVHSVSAELRPGRATHRRPFNWALESRWDTARGPAAGPALRDSGLVERPVYRIKYEARRVSSPSANCSSGPTRSQARPTGHGTVRPRRPAVPCARYLGVTGDGIRRRPGRDSRSRHDQPMTTSSQKAGLLVVVFGGFARCFRLVVGSGAVTGGVGFSAIVRRKGHLLVTALLASIGIGASPSASLSPSPPLALAPSKTPPECSTAASSLSASASATMSCTLFVSLPDPVTTETARPPYRRSLPLPPLAPGFGSGASSLRGTADLPAGGPHRHAVDSGYLLGDVVSCVPGPFDRPSSTSSSASRSGVQPPSFRLGPQRRQRSRCRQRTARRSSSASRARDRATGQRSRGTRRHGPVRPLVVLGHLVLDPVDESSGVSSTS